MEPTGRVYARSENFVFRRIDEETILVPIQNDVGDMDNIYRLNPMGAFIWRQLEGGNTLEAVGRQITAEFDVAAETALADLREFIAELESIGAVHLTDREER